ncbi:hypothetical protein [Efunavirus EF1]|uniref:Uncharacterized protein n=1 Tax=Enterococcus phage EF1 TaxID=2025813 RepID=A0A249XXK6_9CAUD|nr:hypothetical protein [Enterococcus phage EF1]ASZ77481.1 hypothetical protein [Enterococcus phage EF5]
MKEKEQEVIEKLYAYVSEMDVVLAEKKVQTISLILFILIAGYCLIFACPAFINVVALTGLSYFAFSLFANLMLEKLLDKEISKNEVLLEQILKNKEK